MVVSVTSRLNFPTKHWYLTRSTKGNIDKCKFLTIGDEGDDDNEGKVKVPVLVTRLDSWACTSLGMDSFHFK